MNVEANVKYRIQKPVQDVFAAIIDPAKMSQYFISGSSGPMRPGTAIDWEFGDVGARLPVDVIEVEENRRIIFDWAASGVKTRVTILLEAADSDTTIVGITEACWPMDAEGVRRALGQTTGWTDYQVPRRAAGARSVSDLPGRTRWNRMWFHSALSSILFCGVEADLDTQ